ncbi:PAS domain S-box protein [Geomonas sp. Red69]|uniref:hybrid sensor histidine kinase/response regulator n=1 Tax=Geomonas diazotrophica TaxID=2843197 RepID=UPI001C115027|nr:PAS domain-containing sensor histidine kinase [Geomonas diazotrophica]MBU5639084.1 PAS domain S-box protein [Geomonas diazotrophica]
MDDITEHRCTDPSFNQRHIAGCHFFDNSPFALFRSKLDGSEIINANDKFFELLGLDREEVLGKPFLSHYADPAQRSSILCTANEEGHIVDAEVQFIHKNGEVRDCLASVTVFRDEGVLEGILLDVTEKKRTEAALLKTVALYRDFVEGTSDLVTQVDATGRFLFVNRNAEKYFGWSPAECVGKFAFDFVHPDDRQKTSSAFQEWVRSGTESVTFENRQLSRTGEVYDMLWTVNLSYEDNKLKQINSIARDVTIQRRLLNEQVKNQKLESLGVLAGGIAHDFNNIMTGIMGSIALARMSLDSHERLSALLAQAEGACLRATNLSNQLLTFAKGNRPVKKLVTAKALVESAIALALKGAKTRGVINCDDGVWDLEADEGLMVQVLCNIIINASQAMLGGGVISIALDNVVLEKNNEQSLPPGPYVRFSFADSGCGISKDSLRRVFDPYYTTKATGSGLGLASAYSIVCKHDGHIGVDSEEGVGTTCTVLLPASSCKGHTGQGLVPRTTPAKRLDGPILVVDDEEIIRNLATETLRKLGYEVQACSSGEQAIALYHAAMTAETSFAIVVMDLTIPGGMGGGEAARRILELDPAAVLVVSSGYSNDPILADYARFGFSAVLPKPYSPADLEEVLAELTPASSLD